MIRVVVFSGPIAGAKTVAERPMLGTINRRAERDEVVRLVWRWMTRRPCAVAWSPEARAMLAPIPTHFVLPPPNHRYEYEVSKTTCADRVRWKPRELR